MPIAARLPFKAGNYTEAVYDWRHALVDDPQNGTLGMLLSQALFANGQFDDAAGSTQIAMGLLPQDQWGVVVKNYRDLYPSGQAFTDQLRSLEKARNDKPENPAVRFLLGFQYYYLGYPSQAAHELQKCLELAPQDEVAKTLMDLIRGVSTPPATPSATPSPSFGT